MENKKCDIEFVTYVTEYDDCYILSIVIEKAQIPLFETEKYFEAYFNFKTFFIDENINSENPIARCSYKSQPVVSIPKI